MKIVSILCVLVFAFAACKSDPTAPNDPPIAAPTSISVQNVDTSSIKVSWSRASNDTKPDTVVVLSQGTLVKAQAANKPDSTAVVHGLQPGVLYTISIHSANNSSTSVQWTIPGAPTNIVVQNVDTATIIVAWARAKGDAQADTVVVSWMGVPIKTAIANAPDSATLVLGLHPGIAYTISVHSSNAISASVPWTIPIPPPQQGFGSPNVGSSFLFDEWQIDSTGRRSLVDTFRYTVVATGISTLGKSHVTQFLLGFGSNSQMLYVNYEPNGDMDVFESYAMGGGVWVAIPLASKGQISTTTEDTVMGGTSYVTTETYTYAGTEDITVANRTFKNAIKILDKSIRLTNGSEQNPQPAGTVWFSSDLGWVVKSSSPAYSYSGTMQSAYEEDLISYILK